jgi:hypothetical protein
MPLTYLVAVALLLIPLAQDPRPASGARPGKTHVNGHLLADDGGDFSALGASLFWGAWGYKHDRARLDSHLKLLADHHFDYIRVLGVVGRQPYWAGREVDWRWPDYKDVIAGLTDYTYDRYGLRVEWTIFADADQMIPDRADRFRLVDTFLEMTRGREHKIMHLEVANESWQNGFGGAEGIKQIREIASYLASRTDIPVAISDSQGQACADHLVLYKDVPVEIMTEHFSRDVNGSLGRWEPILAPWHNRECAGLPPVTSSNEPIGPGSSVESETDPTRIVAAAISAYMSGSGLYVFHTDAGVWGRDALADMSGARQALDGLSAMKTYLPADIPNWQHELFRQNAGAEAGIQVFVPIAGDTRGALATESSKDGARQVLTSVKGGQFVVVPLGIVEGVTLEARRAVTFDVLHPLSGQTLEHHTLKAGETVRLTGQAVLILKGTFEAQNAAGI